MEVLAAAALAGMLAYAAATRAMEPEALLSLLTAVILVYQPVKELGRVTQFAVQAGVAGERIFALLDLRHPVEDAPDAVPAPALSRSLRLEGVTFAYGERRALDGLTLELPVGKVTALVGPSGGGKSTVTSLLLRFERPRSGRLLLDGVEADRYTAASVRAQFALVTQEPLLFSGSVLENVRFARPDATREEVEEAARVANADGFIRALPEGYETRIGERGVKLSGGQRQRLCIARAVLSRAPVLVLDEATSSLDPESEREVQAALAAVLPGRTALVIAHRLSTVMDAAVLHVVEAGRIVESGGHEELLRAGGRYAELWSLQTGGPERGAA
jgi:subfamily B ATP-binding cassette protein MsbA